MTQRRDRALVRRALAVTLITGGLLTGGVGTAVAAPDFGPGNSSKGPHDPGAKCHPPGQTVGDPGCR